MISFDRLKQRSLNAHGLDSPTLHTCNQKKASRWRVHGGVFSGSPLCTCTFISPISSTSACSTDLHGFSFIFHFGCAICVVTTVTSLRLAAASISTQSHPRTNCAILIAYLWLNCVRNSTDLATPHTTGSVRR
jgi:hypothetical protein